MNRNTNTSEGEKLIVLDPHVVQSTSDPDENRRENLNHKLEFLGQVGEEIAA